MLYKVGGLLYMDRSRQAIRKCMEPLTSTAKLKIQPPPKRPINKQKITDFLQMVKSCGTPPSRLHLFKDDKTGNLYTAVKAENIVSIRNELSQKATDELERMRHVLSNSSKILNNLAADENEMRKFRTSTRLKRRSDRLKHLGVKKIKQESMSDENYDINTLLSFDKCIAKTEDMGGHHFATMSSDGYAAAFAGMAYEKADQPAETASAMMEMPYGVYLGQENGAGSAYAENETAQLLQTYKDLENEIRNTVGPNIQELYPAQQMQTTGLGAGYMGFMDATTAQTGIEFKEACESDYKAQMENHIEETISKNYSLLEEYCKNIPTDQLFMDNNYENGAPIAGGKLKNEVLVNNPMYAERAPAEVPAAQVDGLNFDTQLLNSYLSSISADAAGAQNAGEMNYVGAARQYEMAPEQSMSKEQMYEEILTLNKQFQGRYDSSWR